MNQLGDLMFSLPLLKSARKVWHQEKLYCVIKAELSPLLKATGLVDEVVARNKGLLEKLKLISFLRQQQFTKAVLFSESPEVLMLSYAAGIPERIGFQTASMGFLLTDKCERLGVPSMRSNCNLAKLMGLNDVSCDYTGLVIIPQEHAGKISRWISSQEINESKIVIVSTGTSRRRTGKRWDKNKWVELLKLIASRNFLPILTGSPQEYEYLNKINESASGKAKVFCSQDGLLAVAALFSKARLFVGIDSGAMHLAAGLNVQCVALFGQTDPGQVGPVPIEKHRIIKRNSMSEITVDEVWEQICKILNPR